MTAFCCIDTSIREKLNTDLASRELESTEQNFSVKYLSDEHGSLILFFDHELFNDHILDFTLLVLIFSSVDSATASPSP